MKGEDFEAGAVILIDGQPQKTRNADESPHSLLIGKKAGKGIASGQTVRLQVRNADARSSNEFIFTRP